MITAMQELKDNSLFTEGEEYIQIVLKKTEWIELFEKEKEQIINAYEDGKENQRDSITNVYNYIIGEFYYNQTYNQNES
jgi:hypothetical protein